MYAFVATKNQHEAFLILPFGNTDKTKIELAVGKFPVQAQSRTTEMTLMTTRLLHYTFLSVYVFVLVHKHTNKKTLRP